MAEEDGGLPQAGKDRIFEEITPSIQGGPRKENNPSNRNEFSKERSILSSGFDELHEPSRNSESFSDVQFSSRRQFFDLRKNWADFPTLISGGIKWSQNFYETVLKKHVNFYRLHFLYFIIVDLIGTLLIWLSPPTSLGRISFIDALFNCTSALCVTGLVSVKMNTFSVFNQVVLLFLMLVGGQVFTSLLPVLIRRYYFRKHLLEQEKEASQRRSLPPPPPPLLPPLPPPPPPPSQLPLRPINEQKSLSNLESWTMKEDQNTGNVSVTENVPITNGTDMERATGPRTETGTETETEARRYSMSDEKASLLLRRTPTQTFTERGKPPIPHAHTWGGNTAKALGLEFQQIRKRYFSSPEGVEGEMRESIDYALVDSLQLRSLEYRALQLLSWLIPSYLLGIQLFAFFILRINFWGAPGQRNQLGTYDVSPTFFSAFQTVSAFQNAGFSLLDLNLIPFQKAIVFLTVMGALILLGNTLYAPSLRGIIYSLYCLSKYLEKKGKKRAILLTETLKYLLDHPRKCFTHLFPWHQTLWLVITVIAFNFIETFFLCLFDWNLSVFYGLSGGYKVLDSTFQSLNTRSSGFVVLPLSLISPAMLVLYTGMMYVAVYPVFLSRQTSKADEEVYDDTEIGITPMLEVKDSHLLGQARLLIARALPPARPSLRARLAGQQPWLPRRSRSPTRTLPSPPSPGEASRRRRSGARASRRRRWLTRCCLTKPPTTSCSARRPSTSLSLLPCSPTVSESAGPWPARLCRTSWREGPSALSPTTPHRPFTHALPTHRRERECERKRKRERGLGEHTQLPPYVQTGIHLPMHVEMYLTMNLEVK